MKKISTLSKETFPIFPPRTNIVDEIEPDTSKFVSSDKKSKPKNDW